MSQLRVPRTLPGPSWMAALAVFAAACGTPPVLLAAPPTPAPPERLVSPRPMPSPAPATPVRGTATVVLATELGRIVVEVDATRAPITAGNFLRYVERGEYDGGLFHRTVREGNQPGKTVLIDVIQASAAQVVRGFLAEPLPINLERTRETGLRHLDGTISMARDGADTATSDFFICIGDQPELDFGGRRNPDGQGFAAFGRVVEGMDVVRRIHRAAADGQSLTPPILIRSAQRTR